MACILLESLYVTTAKGSRRVTPGDSGPQESGTPELSDWIPNTGSIAVGHSVVAYPLRFRGLVAWNQRLVPR